MNALLLPPQDKDTDPQPTAGSSALLRGIGEQEARALMLKKKKKVILPAGGARL